MLSISHLTFYPALQTTSRDAMAQTVQIELEYLMTVHADLDPPQLIDTGSRIVNVRGGWADGPKIRPKVIAPGADWLPFRTGAEKYT